MRKLLPLLLPGAIVGVLLATIILEISYKHNPQVLGMSISKAAAVSRTSGQHTNHPFASPLSAVPQTQTVKKLRPTPTITPTPTATPTPTPIKKPLPTPTSTPTPKPLIQATQNASVSLSSQEQAMIDGINAYRSSLGLPSVKPDKTTCDFAQTRAHELTSNFSHDGFTSRINNHTLPYPSYTEITENIAQTQDPTQVVTMWINSPGHAENMRRDTPFVCVKGESGNYAYEGWKE